MKISEEFAVTFFSVDMPVPSEKVPVLPLHQAVHCVSG
jgi:hypothetical protein